jgi:hypothetical protein
MRVHHPLAFATALHLHLLMTGKHTTAGFLSLWKSVNGVWKLYVMMHSRLTDVQINCIFPRSMRMESTPVFFLLRV